jgi:hypothetical protein
MPRSWTLYLHRLGKIFGSGYDGIDRIVVQVSLLAVAKSLPSFGRIS